LGDVAAAAGFWDQTHLARAIRDAIGHTPRDYRRSGCVELNPAEDRRQRVDAAPSRMSVSSEAGVTLVRRRHSFVKCA
jgi:AraC-like DNA-binding protein